MTLRVIRFVRCAVATWVLDAVFELPSKRIAAAIEMLLHHEALSLQDPDVISAALPRFREGPSVGFYDCLVLETARKAGHLPLGTFDRRLARLEGTEKL